MSGQAAIREADGGAQDTTETGLKLNRSPQPGTSKDMAELGLHSDRPQPGDIPHGTSKETTRGAEAREMARHNFIVSRFVFIHFTKETKNEVRFENLTQ